MQAVTEIQALIAWHYAMGADEVLEESPINHLESRLAMPIEERMRTNVLSLAAHSRPLPEAKAKPSALAEAQQLAAGADSLASLEAVVRTFEGCALKKSARNCVFAAGNPQGGIMLIGDSPDDADDLAGTPFAENAATGQLLNKMLASIGLTRQRDCYLTHALFWRPSGGRAPTSDEIALCRPFVERHIALVSPKLLILTGTTAVKMLLNDERGMMRLRGEALHYASIPARVIYAPSHLLKQPALKKITWHDLLAIRSLIDVA